MRSAVGMPPMHGGFLSDVPIPDFLLKIPPHVFWQEKLWVVPMEVHGNPVYDRPPGNSGYKMLRNLNEPRIILEIALERNRWVELLYAKIPASRSDVEDVGYVCLYTRKVIKSKTETWLWCKLVEPPGQRELRYKCLCGKCELWWHDNGWRCPWLSSTLAEMDRTFIEPCLKKRRCT